MKRILILFLAFALLLTGFPVSAGTLPSGSEIFSPFPSLTDATGKKPEQSDVLPDGSHRDTYTGVTLNDYEAFSEYLDTAGFKLVSYDVSNSVLTAVLQKDENMMTFSYDSANTTAVLTYPVRLPEDVSQEAAAASEPEPAENYITFGTYPQEGNGAPQPIEWITVGKVDDGLLLLSRYGLDARPFSEDASGLEWDSCALRAWLNGDFYETAFSSAEQARLLTFTADNTPNPFYSGVSTVNRVALLSCQELEEMALPEDILKTLPTPYALSRGAEADPNTGCCSWWLRSPEKDSAYPTVVAPDGTVGGTDHFDGTVTVRPVIIYYPSAQDAPSASEALPAQPPEEEPAQPDMSEPESPEEEPASSGEIVYTSRITRQQFTAEPGITKGFSLSRRYNSSSSDLLLPDPVDWSRGEFTRLGTEEASDGTYYQFQAVDKSKNEKLMMDYIEALKQIGYTCKKEKLMTLVVYHISKSKKEVAAISLRSRVGKGSYMTCLLPPECGFEIKEEAAVKEYRLSSVYKEDTKETYSVTGFDGESGSGSFSLNFSPVAYHEGDRFSLDDFLTQTRAGFNSSLYYCTFRTPADGDRPFSTLEYTMYQAGSSAYFKELTVEVLRKNASETVLYFYLEADGGTGVHHQLEGLIDVVHEEEPAVYTASPENGGSSVTKLKNCRVCGGKGYDTCPKCSGSGKVRCTKCGGDGKSYNAVSKKEKKCTRCMGTGKQDCSSCTNGKRRCNFCGGDGHVPAS